MSLEDYFKRWFENYKKADLRESSIKMYQTTMMNINKYFNGITLSNLSTVKLQKSLDEFGLTHSLGSTRMLWAHIKASLIDAKVDRLVRFDTWSRVKPRAEKAKRIVSAISATEFKRFSDYLYENIDNDLNRLYLTALESGARLGEIQALTYSDFNFEKNTISISKSYSRAIQKVTDTKNTQSHRVLTMTDQYMNAIKPFVVRHQDIFAKPHPSTLARDLRETLNDVDIEYHNFHALRHSHASFLLHNGVSIQYVSKRLGHKNTKITLEVYAHMLTEEEKNQNDIALSALEFS